MVNRFCFLFLPFFISCFYLSAQQIDLSVQTGHSATINKLVFSPDSRLLASAGSDNTIVLWDVASGRQLLTLTGHTRKVNDLAFHPTKPLLISCSDDKRMITWDLNNAIPVDEHLSSKEVKAIAYSPDGNIIAIAGKQLELYNASAKELKTLPMEAKKSFTTVSFSHDGKLVAIGGEHEGSVFLIRTSDQAIIDKLSLNSKQLVFSSDDRYLLGAGTNGKLRKWDLQKNNISAVTMTADRVWQTFNCAAINDDYFIGGNRNNLISVYSIASKNKIKILNGHDFGVNAVALSPDKTILVSAGEDKKIIFWNLNNWEISKVLKGATEKITDIELLNNSSSMIVSYSDGSFRYLQTSPGGSMVYNKLIPKKFNRFLRWNYSITDIREVNGSEVEMTGQRLKSKKKNTDRFKSKEYVVRWNFENNQYSIDRKGEVRVTLYDSLLNKQNLLSESASYKSFTTEDNKLIVENKNKGLKNTVDHEHTDRITAVKIDEDKGLLFTAGFDGIIQIRDLHTQQLMTNLLATNESDYIFITPENYYFSTKGALSTIGFRIKSQVYSFEQFDLKYNRPDIVLDALDHPDTTVTYAYRKAYEKRIKKLQRDEQDLISFDDVPTLEVIRQDLSPSSKNKTYSIKFNASPGKSELQALYVSVNGVPVFPKGMPLQKGSMEGSIDLELSYGINKVMAYVTNSKGISSLKHNFQVSYKSGKNEPVLYLVTIGASVYQQEKYNLKYAAKDAQDVEALFARSGKFGSIKKISLLDKDVTLENFKALESFLSEATVDDMVIISYAGHGVLDNNLDYFLSTYNIDFNNPSKDGLAFSVVENLLENIKSRNKVLMIDACHSGEIDKEELTISTDNSIASAEGNISFRTVGTGVIRKNSPGLKTSFELSKTLFADLNTTHGAVVISSAGGVEYAIEGTEWNNGIFTYCLINGLKSKNSDLNSDGNTTVRELLQYLGTEVPRLTDGRQTPTSREENLDNDFVIW